MSLFSRIRTRKTPNKDTFYAVLLLNHSLIQISHCSTLCLSIHSYKSRKFGANQHNSKHIFGTGTWQQKLDLALSFETQSSL